MLHELDAVIYAVGLEVLEVETAARVGRVSLAGEVDELGEGTTDLQNGGIGSVKTLVGICKEGRRVYIDGNMAHDGGVIGQANITRFAGRGTAGTRAWGGQIRIDNEGALDIDLDTAGSVDAAVNLLGRGAHCACSSSRVVVVVHLLDGQLSGQCHLEKGTIDSGHRCGCVSLGPG